MKKGLLALDVIQIILSVIGMFVFAFIFFVVETNQRYLFLACIAYAAVSFIKGWQEMEDELSKVKATKTKRIKKEALKKVSA